MAYTDEQKAQALAVYATEGLPQAAASVGCTKATVLNWARAAEVEPPERSEATQAATAEHVRIMGERRRSIRMDLATKTTLLLNRIDDDETPSKCQSLAVAAAILIDKLAVVGWGDAEATQQTGNPDLERMREDARKKGRALVAV